MSIIANARAQDLTFLVLKKPLSNYAQLFPSRRKNRKQLLPALLQSSRVDVKGCGWKSVFGWKDVLCALLYRRRGAIFLMSGPFHLDGVM